MADTQCSKEDPADVGVSIMARFLSGEVQTKTVRLEMPVEELRDTLAADVSDFADVKLFLGDIELGEGSCADAGLAEGVEISCVKVVDVSRQIRKVMTWAVAQRCKFDIDFHYRFGQMLNEQGIELDVEAFVDLKDDDRCLSTLAWLSNLEEYEFEEKDCEAVLNQLEHLGERDGYHECDEHDDWTVEMAIARCLGRICPSQTFGPKLALLCARSIDSFADFTVMAAVIAMEELFRREKTAFHQQIITSLLDGIVGSVAMGWISEEDDCGDTTHGSAEFAKHAVVAVCHLAVGYGDLALLQRLQAVVKYGVASELLTQSDMLNAGAFANGNHDRRERS